MRNAQVLKLLAAQAEAHQHQLNAILSALKPEVATTLVGLPERRYNQTPVSAVPQPQGRYIVDEQGMNGFWINDGNVAPVDLSMFPSPFDLLDEQDFQRMGVTPDDDEDL